MNKLNIFRDVQASLLRFCQEFRAYANTQGFNLGFVNLDAHADQASWPEGDFIGMGELTLTMRDFDEVQVGFAIATAGDPNLLRMGKLVNELANFLMPGRVIMVLDAATGEPRMNLCVTDGVQIQPPVDTKTRPLVPMLVNLLADR